MGKGFTKRAKLSKMDHLFILLFIIGAIYLSWALWHPIPYSVPIIAAIALYALFFLTVEYRNIKGKTYQNAIASFQRQYSSISANATKKPKISKTYMKGIDLKTYISDRNNRNLFIAGRSGSGKSTLMRYIINLFPGSAKTIFSFKAGDEYLKLGIPILRISEHAGDPFADKEAFVQSFLVTYPMNAQGVVAASVPNLLRTVLKESDSWKSLKKNIDGAMEKEKNGSITHSAYNFVQQKLADLELASAPTTIDLNKDVVLDFSGLNEAAKSFYAELYLRQAWHSIEASQPNPMQHIVIIDEAHRLLKSEATIFGEVARLIRSRGALWCGTQNYSDLPDYVRNQFAIHLLFSTKSEKDLRALKAINELLPYVATELRDHHFTDAAMRELHEAIPIYTADIGGFKDYAETYILVEDRPVQRQETSLQDYADRLLAALEIEASWPNKLAKEMAKQENKEVDYCKAIVSKALHKLEKEGRIAREKIALEDKEVTLYYRKDPAMSGLHKFMEREVTKKLEENGIAYELAKPGEEKADIITKDFDIEIETGLKNDIKVFVQRLSAKSRTYVIVPNEAEKERYQKAISNPAIVITQLNGIFKIL